MPSEVQIEEKSLLPMSAMADRSRPGAPEMMSSGSDMVSSAGIRTPSAASSIPGVSDSGEEAPNGIRLYGFMLAPKEKLKVKLECERHNFVVMKISPRPQADAMSAQVRKANMPPRSVRASRIEITNVTDEPYEVILALSGQVNYWYKLAITRS